MGGYFSPSNFLNSDADACVLAYGFQHNPVSASNQFCTRGLQAALMPLIIISPSVLFQPFGHHKQCTATGVIQADVSIHPKLLLQLFVYPKTQGPELQALTPGVQSTSKRGVCGRQLHSLP